MRRKSEVLMNTCYGIEKRRSERVQANLKADISCQGGRQRASVRNISRHGALLSMRSLLDPGNVMSLSLRLPTAAGSVDVKARVVRMVTICSAWGSLRYDIGVEFINLIHDQKEKLAEAVNALLGCIADTK